MLHLTHKARTLAILDGFGPGLVAVFGSGELAQAQRRLDVIDQIVLLLTARVDDWSDLHALRRGLWRATAYTHTVSRITEKVTGEPAEWASRPLEAIYPVVFVDVIVVMVSDGASLWRPVPCREERRGEPGPRHLRHLGWRRHRGCSIRCTVTVSTVQGVPTAGPAIVCAATGRVMQRRQCQGIGRVHLRAR
ncbi:transposase [Cutibacterium equinum]|uniref:transposase n=1 Tax=Cutibacterium equinum TaxID=3016342 RepID=UPI0038CD7BA1